MLAMFENMLILDHNLSKQLKGFKMVNVKIWEYETSAPTDRTLPLTLAHKLGLNGGFYKVQIIGDNDQIDFEYKA